MSLCKIQESSNDSDVNVSFVQTDVDVSFMYDMMRSDLHINEKMYMPVVQGREGLIVR
jgi:hypothetical protein